eukprot:scaffold2489_cov110-Isochrysis_galbana.AAC.2
MVLLWVFHFFGAGKPASLAASAWSLARASTFAPMSLSAKARAFSRELGLADDLPAAAAVLRPQPGMVRGPEEPVASAVFSIFILSLGAAKFRPITVTDVQSDGRPLALPGDSPSAPHVRAAVAAA